MNGTLRPLLAEGWYLMSVRDLEIELGRLRDPARRHEVSNAVPLSRAEALEVRASGNLPDELDRSLRLVLEVDEEPLHLKRLRFEPDYHAEPTWRKEGSRLVNVVPLTRRSANAPQDSPWWEHPDVADLEREWQERGTVSGLRVAEAYRGFVLKTAAALRASGSDVTADAVLASMSRWLQSDQLEELRRALLEEGGRE